MGLAYGCNIRCERKDSKRDIKIFDLSNQKFGIIIDLDKKDRVKGKLGGEIH